MRETLAKTPGVESVEVDYENKTATIIPGDGFSVPMIIAALEAVEGQSYSATVN